MSKSPEKVLRSLPSEKVLERLKTCVYFYNDSIDPAYNDIHLNVKLLRHAIESCLLDINRMKAFHDIPYADCHKRAAFTMIWITRAHPIQLATNVNMTEGLLIINEIYALGLGLVHLDINMRELSPKWIKNMLYILHFRTPGPEILASTMYALDCAMHGKKP